MELIMALMVLVGLFGIDNQEFLQTVETQTEQGLVWEWVGKSKLDENALSIPLQICDEDDCDEPYIFWRLK
tara:strand:+ start:691 stop:903 length:213 start_codon:yes stop_codon:yes gene_type:complete